MSNNPTPPNIDQRLERLVERHEALTQTVEMLAQMHQDNERKHEQRFAHMESLIERVVAVSETLASIAGNHEQRLKDLEG